jgi:hypothetical protein
MPVKYLISLGFVVSLFLGVINECGRTPHDVCTDFFDLPAQQQEIEFRRFPVEKQLLLYRCGMSLHPKTIGLAYLIADGGQKNIPILMDSLRSEKNESIQADQVYIFEVLADRGELKGRRDVASQLYDIVSEMHGTPKERAEDSVQKIMKEVQEN